MNLKGRQANRGMEGLTITPDGGTLVGIMQIKDVIAEKIEGLAWGPDLPDGRHVLYVASDNDLFPDLPTQLYAFAIDGSPAAANLAYQPQRTGGPMYPPGQVKKALREQ
jgi:hypothetical protein